MTHPAPCGSHASRRSSCSCGGRRGTLAEVLGAVAHLLDDRRRCGTSARRRRPLTQIWVSGVGSSASCQCRRRALSGGDSHRGRPVAPAPAAGLPPVPLEAIELRQQLVVEPEPQEAVDRPSASKRHSSAAQVAGGPRCVVTVRPSRCSTSRVADRGCRWQRPACAAGCSAAEDVERGHLVDRRARQRIDTVEPRSQCGRQRRRASGTTSLSDATRSRSESGTSDATNTPRSELDAAALVDEAPSRASSPRRPRRLDA